MKNHNYTSGIDPARPLLRSLLQKAVRRGYPDIVQKVVSILADYGDTSWVHSRAGVIAFEECWTCGYLLASGTPPIVTLHKVATVKKNKDAAGLGSLAYAAVGGSSDAIETSIDPVSVKIVAAAIRRPDDFFNWAVSECQTESQLAIVLAAKRFISKASWPWDKAFMIAGAYLSCKGKAKIIEDSSSIPTADFPYWVAVDKHTPQGKKALRQVALELGVSENILGWASFYFESSKLNEEISSLWWGNESRWRFETLGSSSEEAKKLWKEAAPKIESIVQAQSERLLRLVECSSRRGGGSSGFELV